MIVTHPNGQYEIKIGRNILHSAIDPNKPFVIISDSNVAPLYAHHFPTAKRIITLPAGEEYKRLETVNAVYGQLLESGIDRKGTILALGGGVIGDMAGFIAATYLRGIAVVQCPTTLLSMVDASVGGKTGVDLPEGKNLVGAFKQPERVVIDLDTLKTLPAEELASGMAEVIKAGLIGDISLFTTLEQAEISSLQSLISHAIEVKRHIVEEDPYEHGRRALLNLGHTFGHAIEQVSNYVVRHGYGVAMGLVAAARLSATCGYCVPELQQRIECVLKVHHLPTRIPSKFSAESIYQAMHSDKKKERGTIRFILIRAVGDCFVDGNVSAEIVKQTLTDLGAH